MLNSSILLSLVLVFLVSSTVGDTGGIFTVNCVPLTFQRSDPIVTPGVAGTHVHAIIGGNAFKRTMGKMDATSANSTTCDKALDHSNYWVPQLYHYRSDKTYEIVKLSGAAVYYLLRACDYQPNIRSCAPLSESNLPLAFPDGFRMVAGDPHRRTQNNSDFAQTAVSFVCLGGTEGGDIHGFPKSHCDRLRSQVFFPSCWNGVDLDSPDHKSHVAYPAIGDYNTGVCPKSHPVALFSIFFEFFFETGSIPDYNHFAFANGDSTGFGYHGDFVMGWTDRNALQHGHKGCVTAADCPNLGSQAATSRPLIYPAVYEEEIGLKGPISTLPGNNPITWPN